jgi:hypothetical protein
MAERPSISREPIGGLSPDDAEPSGAVVVRRDLTDAVLGLHGANTILAHR